MQRLLSSINIYRYTLSVPSSTAGQVLSLFFKEIPLKILLVAPTDYSSLWSHSTDVGLFVQYCRGQIRMFCLDFHMQAGKGLSNLNYVGLYVLDINVWQWWRHKKGAWSTVKGKVKGGGGERSTNLKSSRWNRTITWTEILTSHSHLHVSVSQHFSSF